MKSDETLADEIERNLATLWNHNPTWPPGGPCTMKGLTNQKQGQQSWEPMLQDTRSFRTKHLRRMEDCLQEFNTICAVVADEPETTVGAAFVLIAQDTVCDTNLPDGLLQILIFNSNRRQVAGARIIITWENGEEQFFTGLKPEIGNGYADYSMSPNIVYTVRLASGSDIASELAAPTCQTPSGEAFLGGLKLTYQQP